MACRHLPGGTRRFSGATLRAGRGVCRGAWTGGAAGPLDRWVHLVDPISERVHEGGCADEWAHFRLRVSGGRHVLVHGTGAERDVQLHHGDVFERERAVHGGGRFDLAVAGKESLPDDEQLRTVIEPRGAWEIDRTDVPVSYGDGGGTPVPGAARRG